MSGKGNNTQSETFENRVIIYIWTIVRANKDFKSRLKFNIVLIKFCIITLLCLYGLFSDRIYKYMLFMVISCPNQAINRIVYIFYTLDYFSPIWGLCVLIYLAAAHVPDMIKSGLKVAPIWQAIRVRTCAGCVCLVGWWLLWNIPGNSPPNSQGIYE